MLILDNSQLATYVLAILLSTPKVYSETRLFALSLIDGDVSDHSIASLDKNLEESLTFHEIMSDNKKQAYLIALKNAFHFRGFNVVKPVVYALFGAKSLALFVYHRTFSSYLLVFRKHGTILRLLPFLSSYSFIVFKAVSYFVTVFLVVDTADISGTSLLNSIPAISMDAFSANDVIFMEDHLLDAFEVDTSLSSESSQDSLINSNSSIPWFRNKKIILVGISLLCITGVILYCCHPVFSNHVPPAVSPAVIPDVIPNVIPDVIPDFIPGDLPFVVPEGITEFQGQYFIEPFPIAGPGLIVNCTDCLPSAPMAHAGQAMVDPLTPNQLLTREIYMADPGIARALNQLAFNNIESSPVDVHHLITNGHSATICEVLNPFAFIPPGNDIPGVVNHLPVGVQPMSHPLNAMVVPPPVMRLMYGVLVAVFPMYGDYEPFLTEPPAWYYPPPVGPQ